MQNSNTGQRDTNTNRIVINNEQKDDSNYITVKSNSDETNENYTKYTRYKRTVESQDRLTYYLFINIFLINILSIHIHSIYL